MAVPGRELVRRFDLGSFITAPMSSTVLASTTIRCRSNRRNQFRLETSLAPSDLTPEILPAPVPDDLFAAGNSKLDGSDGERVALPPAARPAPRLPAIGQPRANSVRAKPSLAAPIDHREARGQCHFEILG